MQILSPIDRSNASHLQPQLPIPKVLSAPNPWYVGTNTNLAEEITLADISPDVFTPFRQCHVDIGIDTSYH